MLILSALAAPACSLVTPFDISSHGDAGADADADTSHDAEGPDVAVDGDHDALDADSVMVPGPLVFVGRRVALVAEPICDVDGDGTLDSAVHSLGADMADLFASAMSAAIETARGSGSRPVVHFDWIDDPNAPHDEHTAVTVYAGHDTDVPEDGEDDFSGEEPFYATAAYLGPCGEPLHVVDDIIIDDGAISGGSGTFAQSFGADTLAVSIAALSGTMAPGGQALTLRACGTIAIDDLGQSRSTFGPTRGISFLEGLLSGGAAFGMSAIPGIQPDVDLDGDGTETFVVNDVGHIVQCIDGDFTVIDGRECWQDPRMADAFSVSFEIEGLPARFGGRFPGWEYQVRDDCPSGPPVAGFFSTVPATDTPCVAPGETCDPLALQPCCDETHLCSGGDRRVYRCSVPCTPSECDFGEYRGTCYAPPGHLEPYCDPLGNSLQATGCMAESVGCATEYGSTADTRCFEYRERTYCVAGCGAPAEDCGTSMRCVPNAFEPGGVCAQEP